VLPPVVPGGTAAESTVGSLTAASGVLSVPALTGADLACFRAERKLSQRELAALMGVGHGMVAKAELVRERGLGEGMASAFARVALPATATR
jgi:DNA-binding transcriptional regulator YiaG